MPTTEELNVPSQINNQRLANDSIVVFDKDAETETLQTRLEVSLWYEALAAPTNTAAWQEGIKEKEGFHVNTFSVMREP